MKKILLMTVLAILLTTATSFATPIITFATGTAGGGGTVTWMGPSTLFGNNIRIGSMTVSGAPINNGTYVVTGTAGGWGGLFFDTTTGAVSIVGSVAGLGIGPTTLLVGTIASFTATPMIGNGLNFHAQGSDAKDPGLLVALGIAPNQPFNYFGFDLSNRQILNPNVYEAYSTSIINTAPEPTSIVLLGSGLLALAGLARKRLS